VYKEEGETYRNQLIEKCESLGIADKVDFVNEFASLELLKDYLTACDMYVTPYPNENQISSGTLSFALGAGAAVISTPYLYARDLLADERGLLFDFCDANAPPCFKLYSQYIFYA
jgi:glycosyltransferase involved in cell wall biosynthesis